MTLSDHVWTSAKHVLAGVAAGTFVGVPIGLAMGLSSVARGHLDPVLWFMRSTPPLALILQVILGLGIDEAAKTCPLCLGALFVIIIIIAARAGFSPVKIP